MTKKKLGALIAGAVIVYASTGILVASAQGNSGGGGNERDVNVINEVSVHVENDVSSAIPVTIPGGVQSAVPERYQANFELDTSSDETTLYGESEPSPPGKQLVVDFMSIQYVVESAQSTLSHCTVFVMHGPGPCGPFMRGEDISVFYAVPTSSARHPRFTPTLLRTAAALPLKTFVAEGSRICVTCPVPEDNTLVASGSVGITGVLEPME